MTEKKFTLLEDTNGGLDTVLETMVKDNGRFLTHKECCDLLNALHEENELLKNILKDITIQLYANHTLNTYQMTIPVNRVIYNELKRRLKETSFNEELRRFLDD